MILVNSDAVMVGMVRLNASYRALRGSCWWLMVRKVLKILGSIETVVVSGEPGVLLEMIRVGNLVHKLPAPGKGISVKL